MAPRDYKNRGRAPRKTTKKTEPKSNINKGLLLRGLITFAIVLGFGYFLWFLKNTPEDSNTTQSKVEQSKPVKEIPPVPKEEWVYDSLKNAEVEVDIPERKESTKRYQMQCASFKNADPANTMKAKIAFLGIESQVKVTTSKSGTTWYRVVLGPYKKKRDAEKERHRLQNNKINGCKIWEWTW